MKEEGGGVSGELIGGETDWVLTDWGLDKRAVRGMAYLFCVTGVVQAETADCADLRAG